MDASVKAACTMEARFILTHNKICFVRAYPRLKFYIYIYTTLVYDKTKNIFLK